MSPTAQKQRPQPSNLTQRIITGLVALPFVLGAAYLGGWWLVLLVGLLTAVGVIEFCMLGRSRGIEGVALVAVPVALVVIAGIHLAMPELWLGALLLSAPLAYALDSVRSQLDSRTKLMKALISLCAVAYVAVPSGMLVATRNLPNGFVWLLLILFLTWGTDSFAYIGGRLWGKTKLAPQISPKKTVEGAVVGVIGGSVTAIVVLLVTGVFSPMALVPVVVGPFLAILGDLVESWLKRAFQVKDSHLTGLDILPGHGGVLDRVDGLILVTVVTYLYLVLSGLAAL